MLSDSTGYGSSTSSSFYSKCVAVPARVCDIDQPPRLTKLKRFPPYPKGPSSLDEGYLTQHRDESAYFDLSSSVISLKVILKSVFRNLRTMKDIVGEFQAMILRQSWDASNRPIRMIRTALIPIRFQPKTIPLPHTIHPPLLMSSDSTIFASERFLEGSNKRSLSAIPLCHHVRVVLHGYGMPKFRTTIRLRSSWNTMKIIGERAQ